MFPRRFAVAVAAVAVLAAPALAGGVEDGQKSLKEKRFAEAAEAFAKVLKSDPSRREAALGLARAAAEGSLSARYDEADQALHALLKAKPDDRETRLALGNLYLARVAEDDRWRADVQDQFGRLLKADPGDDEAAAGLVRMYFAGADYRRGLETADAFLEKKPGSALVLFWKGSLLYDQAKQGFQRGGQAWTPEVRGQFEAALSAFEASAKADPTRYDAWIQVGYVAQWLAGVDAAKRELAAAAYRKALDLSGDDPAAMRGLRALYDPAKWVEIVDALAAQKPQAPIVLYYHAFSLHQRKRLEDAEKAYRASAKASKWPADAWFGLGKVLEDKGDAAGALEAFRKSLEANPLHARWKEAVTALWKPVYDRMRDAMGNAAKARALVKDAAEVVALAPHDPNVRNDLGFFCREAFHATKDKALLDSSLEYYLQASALVGDYLPEYEQTVPYPSRHGFAQILNDTGLLYQYDVEPRDFAKAEPFYRRAQEWTQNGYWDAYGNLVKVLTAAGRWKEAFDYASDCAEGLRNADGTPNETWRGTARADAARFQEKIPK